MFSRRDPLHVRAQVAGPHELGVRRVAGDVVGHRALGDQHHLLRLARQHIVVHRRGRAGEVGRPPAPRPGIRGGPGSRRPDRPRAISGMSAAVKRSCTSQRPCQAMILMSVWRATLRARNSSGIRITRSTPHCRGGLLDHLHGVGAGAADVGLGLHLGGGVDVGDHRQARIALLDQPHVGAGDRGGQRAAGAQVGDQHGLVRRTGPWRSRP